jgi:hypothetical protein
MDSIKEILMKSFNKQGCEKCRHGVLSGMLGTLKQLAASQGPIFLYRCEECGAWWEENMRESHVITEGEARERFPAIFNAKPKGSD